jgi:tetratricopeptide (TPR) repeat protein
MYRDAMSATAACVLGDVHLRNGQSDAAMAAYRRAWHTVQEYRLIMAYQRIAARAQAGLAAAYATTGEQSRAEDLLERATTLARESEATEHAAAAATMGELYWTIGSAAARLGQSTRALDALRNAIRTGWRDAAWLDVDPEFESLRQTDPFRRLTDEVRRWPGVKFDKAASPT